jgi:glutamate racemase
MKRLPSEDLTYFGDTARVPYGIKSPETVTRYSMEIATFLMDQGIKILVVACNTASSIAIPELTSHFPVPVIGVLRPGASAAVTYSGNHKIGVIGTESTIGSNAYVQAIHEIESNADVYSRACPLFVPLAEEGWSYHPLTQLVAREYLEGLRETGIDTLVLGCTHYPILKSAIRKIMGDGVRLVDSAEETAREVERMLAAQGELTDPDSDPVRKFFVTDSPGRFQKVGERFLKHPFLNVEKVTI